MENKRALSNKMRTYHRYLGFFLAGIMAMYALSGIVLIFRDTDFLKVEKVLENQLAPGLGEAQLGEALKIKNLKITGTSNGVAVFNEGSYDLKTGASTHTVKKLPYLLDKMTHIHKAKSADPLYFLNIFFGLSLLFFVLSSFWMFLPNTPIFKKGLYFAAAGLLLTLLLILV